jgi:hypothetical protein
MSNRKEFSFYLDAWKYCMLHKHDVNLIKRYDWKTWIIEVT